LTECLNSIVQQTFREFEIIIVDGNSTDNSIDTIKCFAETHQNIRWFSETDEGIFDAMNKGIKMAKGTWVYFLGSDDSLINAGVLSLVAAALQDEDEIVYGNSIWIPGNFNDSGPKSYLSLLNEGINHQRVFYKKELFEKFGYYNVHFKFASDLELNNRFFCNPNISKKYINVPVAFFNAGGISATNIDYELWKHWKTIIVKNFSPFVPKNKIYRRLSWYCWYVMQKKNYLESFRLFCAIYFHTLSFTFLKHTASQALKISTGRISS